MVKMDGGKRAAVPGLVRVSGKTALEFLALTEQTATQHRAQKKMRMVDTVVMLMSFKIKAEHFATFKIDACGSYDSS